MIHTTFERQPEGRTLRGDVRMPDGPPPRSAVVVAHGFKGFKDRGFLPWIARRLVRDGHAVVTFNFSGSGVGPRPRERTEIELFATDTYTLGLRELAWIVEGVAAGELLPLAPRRMGLLGHGRGGALALLNAASSASAARVDALVTWGAMARFDRWSEETRSEWRESGRIFVLDELSGGHLPLDVTLLEDVESHRERLDPVAAAARLHVPLAVVHGAEDRTVPPDEARTLARAAPRGRLHLVEGADHAFGTTDPMGEPGPGILEAERVTRLHFRRHLAG